MLNTKRACHDSSNTRFACTLAPLTPSRTRRAFRSTTGTMRRSLVRATYGSDAHVRSGLVMLRFVLADKEVCHGRHRGNMRTHAHAHANFREG